MRVADEASTTSITQVDSLIVVLNEKLFEVMDEDATWKTRSSAPTTC
jgi:cell division GTPase FtsZ